MKKLTTLILSLSLAGLSQFSLANPLHFQQIGVPDQEVPALTTKGMEVNTKIGLKTLLPADWNVFIHKSAALPSTISWKEGDTWTGALASFAEQNNLSLQLDWQEHSLLIRTPEVAMAESMPPSGPTEPASNEIAYVPPPVPQNAGMPPVEVNAPRNMPVDNMGLPVTPPVAMGGTPVNMTRQPTPIHTDAANSFNKADAYSVISTAAKSHGYLVSWEADDARFTGPVTLLGVDPAEDMQLVQKALGGKRSPLAIEVFRKSQLIRVSNRAAHQESFVVNNAYFTGNIVKHVDRPAFVSPVAMVSAGHSDPVASQMNYPPQPSMPVTQPTGFPQAPVQQMPAMGMPGFMAGNTAPVAEQPVMPAAPSVVALNMDKGQFFSIELNKLITANGWSMTWEAKSDFQNEHPLHIEDSSLKAVLQRVLPQLGLSMDIYNPSKMIVIRSAN